MSNWQHGYYADSGYTYGFYAETMPSWIHWVCSLQSHVVPKQNFRYLDAGCGQGVNLLIAAACHPDSEFIGIDFLPEHIAHAERLAKASGLHNVRFLEADFLDIDRIASDLGLFDFVVSHGVTSWVAPEIRTALFHFVSRALKPGGVFYNSYNTLPGWLSVLPFQHLVSLEQQTKSGLAAFESTVALMNDLVQAAPVFKNQLPDLFTRIDKMKDQDRSYLVQEYNNKYWSPRFFSEMSQQMAQFKLDYLGSATMLENGSGFLPPNVAELAKKQTSSLLREQLIDYATFKAFRRDLYVKGQVKAWGRSRYDLFKANRFMINPLAVIPDEKDKFVARVGSISFPLDGAYFLQLRERLLKVGPIFSLGDLIHDASDTVAQERIIHAIAFLLAEKYLFLVNENISTREAQNLNKAMGQSVLSGAPYNYIALPRAGMAIGNSDIDWILLDCVSQGLARQQWPERIMSELKAMGRALMQDGKPVATTKEGLAMAEAQAVRFTQQRLPLLKSLGALD